MVMLSRNCGTATLEKFGLLSSLEIEAGRNLLKMILATMEMAEVNVGRDKTQRQKLGECLL